MSQVSQKEAQKKLGIDKPKLDTNSKLAIKIDSRSLNKNFKFQSKVIPFPYDIPCQIKNLEVFLDINGEQEEETGG